MDIDFIYYTIYNMTRQETGDERTKGREIAIKILT